jgi:hypothetical protein
LNLVYFVVFKNGSIEVAQKAATVVSDNKGADSIKGSGGDEDSWCMVFGL